ncbi:hypothetical protein ACFVBP_10715 [Nocardioides sp. NPDC057764]|uniref:hypothetical protein n=1 Tax=Nocardioides sp. NPDC057764 TaxID=3346243 RepID=UPI00366C9E0E
MTSDNHDDYTDVAAKQLDLLETTADDDLWNSIVDALDLVFRLPAEAQKRSGAITTDDGRIVFRLPVAGHPPYKVFWTWPDSGPLVEAVFPHP